MADQCLLLQADVLAKAGAARMSVDGAPPPNRLRGWYAASPEDLIEVRLSTDFRIRTQSPSDTGASSQVEFGV